ncbi:MAG: 6-carboxytetrahydropterin synthase [Candidatus Kapabacteria bacterium]|nr:MAG: 6-carboxytetrahydropterin synthase [Bacteroidota bacterium]MBW7854513.1 6-carboxytetrahydropterin synthase [Candidatus Kapabacteria bacterium]MBZ0194537.1 6-carboxytetrahydropterin synthase [Candidatus Kapabacteria bacterium]
MLTTISKRFRWEMGHRLPDHPGLCRNIHGHSYAMEVRLAGIPNENGMVMDYFDLTELVRPLIEQLDHCFIINAADAELLMFLQHHGMKTVVVDFATTAENLAEYALRFVVNALPQSHAIQHVTVSIHETEKTSARVELQL